MKTSLYTSPLGTLKITIGEGGLSSIDFTDDREKSDVMVDEDPLIVECIEQLDEYFGGRLRVFSLPLAFTGTDFQLRVWQQLMKIPYGRTISYKELANRLGDPLCIRAAASANGRNPLPVIIPCHRVIGSDGSLTGYAGGLWRKKWLLEHESAGSAAGTQLQLFSSAAKPI